MGGFGGTRKKRVCIHLDVEHHLFSVILQVLTFVACLNTVCFVQQETWGGLVGGMIMTRVEVL